MSANHDIKDALTKADWAEEFDADRDQTFRQMLAGTFKGQARWMTVLVYIYIFAFTALMVVSIVSFFEADRADTRSLILWATGFLMSAVFVSFLKLWIWNIMNRNAVTREIKRLELCNAELTEKLSEK